MRILIRVASDVEARRKKILDILARGNVAVFTSGSLVKKVSEFNPDDDGDIMAFESNGRTKYVCWDSDAYEITEEPKP